MAMTMTGEVTLPAERPKVWALLNDPETLKSAIPGCQSLEKTGENGFAAVEWERSRRVYLSEYIINLALPAHQPRANGHLSRSGGGSPGRGVLSAPR